MAKEDIRRYSMQQIKEMIAKGEYTPTPRDAAEFDGDKDFWKVIEEAAKAKKTAKGPRTQTAAKKAS